MRVTADNVTGLMIDMQKRLFDVVYDKESLEANSKKLSEGLRLFGVPLLVTQQYTHGLGDTLESLSVQSYIEKTTFSCYKNHDFKAALHECQKRNIIIFGIEAHICVLQTVLDLKEMGFNPIVVADCVSSRRPYDKEIALARMQKEGVSVTTYESLLFELCRDSQNEHFRQLSAIVK